MKAFHNYRFMLFVLAAALLFSSVSAFWNFQANNEQTAFPGLKEQLAETGSSNFGSVESVENPVFDLDGVTPIADSSKWSSGRLYNINKQLVAYMGDGVFFSYDLSQTYFFDASLNVVSPGLPPDGLVGEVNYAQKFEEYKSSFAGEKRSNPLNDFVVEEVYLWASTKAKNPKVAATDPDFAKDYVCLKYYKEFYTCNSFVESSLDYVFNDKSGGAYGCARSSNNKFTYCTGFFEKTFTALEPLGFSAMVFIYDPLLLEDYLLDPSKTDPNFIYTDKQHAYFGKNPGVHDLVSKYSSSDNFHVMIFKDADACDSFIAKFPRGGPMQDYSRGSYDKEMGVVIGGYTQHQYMKSDGLKTIEADIGGEQVTVSCTDATAKKCGGKGIFMDLPPDECKCIYPGDVTEGEKGDDGFNCKFFTIGIIYPNGFDPFKTETSQP